MEPCWRFLTRLSIWLQPMGSTPGRPTRHSGSTRPTARIRASGGAQSYLGRVGDFECPGHGWLDGSDGHTGDIEADLPGDHGRGLKISLEYPVEFVTETFGCRPVLAVHQIHQCVRRGDGAREDQRRRVSPPCINPAGVAPGADRGIRLVG